jgi:hypothetical protein
VIRGSLKGAVGKVKYLPSQPSLVETETRVWSAVVEFEDTEEQFVPYFNLELLG